MGAAIQGGVLRGDVKDILLLDVTPLRWAGPRGAPDAVVLLSSCLHAQARGCCCASFCTRAVLIDQRVGPSRL
jgi:hypothetical protein